MQVLSVGSMYPPHHLGGYELTWLSAVRHLRASGHRVRVLVTDHREPGMAADALEEDVHRELRWYWRNHAFPRMGITARLALERHNARVFERHIQDFKPNVLSWWAMGGMSLSLLERARRLCRPAVGVVGDEWLAYGPHVDGWSRLFLGRRRLAAVVDRATGIPTLPNYTAVDTWLFNSDVTRRSALHTGRPIGPTEVVHPGIDARLFRASRSSASPWRGRLLYVGRIDERKGIDTAIGALAHLPEGTTLTVLGRGDERYLSQLRDLAKRSGLGRRVRFGHVPRRQLPREYESHDALVFPVRWEEPWGLVPLEGMAVGIPVVATGTGGSAEYLEHEENCLIFRPRESSEALAAAVRRLSDDDRLHEWLRERGRRTAARFTEERYNEAIRKALECACDTGHRAHAGGGRLTVG